MAEAREKRGNSKKGNTLVKVLAIGTVVGVIAVYIGVGMYYSKRFLPNVSINGVNVAGMTAKQAEKALGDETRNYVLTLQTRDNTNEKIFGTDIDLGLNCGDLLDNMLKEQIPMSWGVHLIKNTDNTIQAMVNFDEVLLKNKINELPCLNKVKMTAPVDAHIDYEEGNGLIIIPEILGNEIDIKKMYEKVEEAVSSLQEELSLNDAGIYVAPEIYQDDPELNEKIERWNKYLATTITYQFGENTEVLDGSIFYDWMSEDSNKKILFDDEQIAEFVRGLARKYNTAYRSKTLKTSYGPTVTISEGFYGWKIDQTAEAEQLKTELMACESVEREPVYSQTAASHTEPDYGNTYVEINLTAQHLYFYKDGNLVIDTDFVSGNISKGNGTPPGAYALTYKQRNATLKGADYSSDVAYWMPFNGNIGMHDSSWRSKYGGDIYKRSGSHGCVNLPASAAKVIFENIEKGMPVLCYNLPGTESKSSTNTGTKKEENTNQEAQNQEIQNQETQNQEIQNQETQDTQQQETTQTPAEPQTPDNTTTPQGTLVTQPDGTVVIVQPDGTIVPVQPATPEVPDNTTTTPAVQETTDAAAQAAAQVQAQTTGQ